MTLTAIPNSDQIATLVGHSESRDEGPSHNISARSEHIFDLDALRFIAALWVVFSHLGPAPIFAGIDRAKPIGFLLQGLWGILYSGPAAVIVFFVISGFCIHFPYAGSVVFRPAPYLIRRYVRIGIPMGVAMALTELSGIDRGFFDAILWSLVAELMYYTLYPLIKRLVHRFGMDAVVFGAFVLSLAVVLTDPAAKGYGVYGWELNWLLGLPCWMLGVKTCAGLGQSSGSDGGRRAGHHRVDVAHPCLGFQFSVFGAQFSFPDRVSVDTEPLCDTRVCVDCF